jgi:hypothetical protein
VSVCVCVSFFLSSFLHACCVVERACVCVCVRVSLSLLLNESAGSRVVLRRSLEEEDEEDEGGG